MKENNHPIFSRRSCLTREELAGYAEGTLSGRQRNSVERHLLDCELCSEALEGIAAMEAGSLPVFSRPSWRGGEKAQAGSRRTDRSRALAIAAAIAVVVLSGAYLLLFRHAGDTENGLAVKTEEAGPAGNRAERMEEAQPPAPAPAGNTVAVQHEERDRADNLSAAGSARPTATAVAHEEEDKPAAAEILADTEEARPVLQPESQSRASAGDEAGSPAGLLAGYMAYKPGREPGAVYIDNYKMSAAYVLSDIAVAPSNSYTTVPADASKARKEKAGEATVKKEDGAAMQETAPGYSRSLQAFFTALESGDTAAAETAIRQFVAAWPADINGRYYRAYLDFLKGDDRSACDGFDFVLDQGDATFRYDAAWYKALSLVRQGRHGEARRVLAPLTRQDNPYRNPATGLAAVLGDQ